MKLNQIFRSANEWLYETPERALNQAYRAALKIREIEDKHFQGAAVSPESSQYGDTTLSYFKTEIQSHLQTIKLRLNEFNTSRFLINLSPLTSQAVDDSNNTNGSNQGDQSSLILEKIQFIDNIVAKYQNPPLTQYLVKNGKVSSASAQGDQGLVNGNLPANQGKGFRGRQKNTSLHNELEESNNRLASVTDKTGVLPRSFLNTINRIKQEIDPKSEETEEAVLKRFRSSRYKTAISIKFILLLIIVPLLTHQLTKTFLVSPLVRDYFNRNEQVIFINRNLEEEAFVELRNFEESLHFKSLIGLMPKLSEEELEEKLKERAQEISSQFRGQGIDAIANIFADIFSLIAFGVVIATNRREIEIVKSFLDGILYNLSDSAKAFLIILFTDMFVGFHSPHGWEVILEGIARHFGLPENREFNFLFIATFPVILDTVLKYWIFRYLNRISPSAVATYRNMNE